MGTPTTVAITRRATFAAAHVLRRDDWDEARNREVFGGCAGDHGHNYTLEVTVAGAIDPETAMVMNLKDVDRVIRRAVVDHVDHRHLNRDVSFLRGTIPTAENLALSFWEQLEPEFAGRLRKVRVVESENNAAEVSCA
jgi:6-pyruvoyltetrahydropterin/6-carboxytetrahydropterin synthase